MCFDPQRFALSPLMGPIMGPLLGGFVVNYSSWHALFWVIGAIGIPIWISQFIFLPGELMGMAMELEYRKAIRRKEAQSEGENPFIH
jgi:MFS family permease